MGKKKRHQTNSITNRRARFDYDLGEFLVVGIQLTGPETKALRLGHGQLSGAYVNIKDGELWLLNATISGSNGLPIDDQSKTRSRKLLAKRKEIDQLIAVKQLGRTIVPIDILNKGKYIKVRISVGKGRKSYDKRQVIKKREEGRNMQAAIKSVLR